MAKVECPGSETWEQGFGVTGTGLDPLNAIINAFLGLLLQLAMSQGLRDFLEKECDGDCWRRVSGPELRRTNTAS
jgi:hypothetical protein